MKNNSFRKLAKNHNELSIYFLQQSVKFPKKELRKRNNKAKHQLFFLIEMKITANANFNKRDSFNSMFKKKIKWFKFLWSNGFLTDRLMNGQLFITWSNDWFINRRWEYPPVNQLIFPTIPSLVTRFNKCIVLWY